MSFEKPKQLRSYTEHNEIYSSDTEINGTYVPNMSAEDMNKYKAKHIKGKDERIEIKKTFGSTQVVAVVYKNTVDSDWRNNVEGHQNVRISANSKIHMSFDDWAEFIAAIEEAKQLIEGSIII